MLAPFWAALALLGLAYARLEVLGRALRRWQHLVLGRHAGRGADDGHAQRAAADRRLAGDHALPRRAARPGMARRPGRSACALARRWATVPLAGAARLLRRRQLPRIFRATTWRCAPTARRPPRRATPRRWARTTKPTSSAWATTTSSSATAARASRRKASRAKTWPCRWTCCPITDNNGKGAAFIVYGTNADYLPLIRLLLPRRRGGADQGHRRLDRLHLL